VIKEGYPPTQSSRASARRPGTEIAPRFRLP
jgi:hypothetical protein